MIRIYPKSRDCDARYQQGYELMHEIFNDLVFCGNLGGHVPAGTEEIFIETDDPEIIRKSATDIWMNELGCEYQPDELIGIEFCEK